MVVSSNHWSGSRTKGWAINTIREATKKSLKFRTLSKIKRGEYYFFVFFWKPSFLLKTSRNEMKQMILSFKMKVDVISDHFLMLWFQKYSLGTVSLKTFSGGPES